MFLWQVGLAPGPTNARDASILLYSDIAARERDRPGNRRDDEILELRKVSDMLVNRHVAGYPLDSTYGSIIGKRAGLIWVNQFGSQQQNNAGIDVQEHGFVANNNLYAIRRERRKVVTRRARDQLR